MKIIKLIFIIFFPFYLSAQESNLSQANQLFNDGNFKAALESYLSVYEQYKDDPKVNYRIGVCYLNTNIDKSEAVKYLEKVIASEKPNPNAYYLLGRAYHYAYKFNEAIKMYEKFKSLSKGTDFNLKDVDHQIEYCQNAIEIMKFPLDVTFENLGPNINSEYPDYYPFVPVNEGFIVFNSRRDDGSEQLPNGSYTAEVYLAKVKKGKFGKAKKISQKINTLTGDEEVIGLSADGKQILFYFDNDKSSGDIYLANFDGKQITKVKKLPKEINSKYTEIAAAISPDGNAIYFASHRPGGYGGVDIYVSRKLPNGKWAKAQNLGPTINTAFDEDFPNISPDGKTLYFSSKGHTSMGGYDIFKASWDPVKRIWVGVKNIGYPINTPEDNMNFRISENGRTGYISAVRADTKGDLDIYSVTFNEVEPKYTVLKGYIYATDSTQKITEVYISVVDNETGEVFGEYLPNPNTGRYVMILPPGNYNLLIEADGYSPIEEDFEVYGKSSFRTEINKNYYLKP
tara:strand:- start:32481 stop:34019 length:1539 start_codon:yes stop_codon:yes gene_type:complete